MSRKWRLTMLYIFFLCRGDIDRRCGGKRGWISLEASGKLGIRLGQVGVLRHRSSQQGLSHTMHGDLVMSELIRLIMIGAD